MAEEKDKYGVLSKKLGGGPHGIGDPNDKYLRKVELDVLIPQKMRDKAKTEKCIPEVKAFTECCKESNLLMVLFCRKENDALKSCLTRWYKDEEFKRQCVEEYLEERSEFRRTGISKKAREKERMALKDNLA